MGVVGFVEGFLFGEFDVFYVDADVLDGSDFLYGFFVEEGWVDGI